VIANMKVKPAPVEIIPIENIEPNPHNPRRLFDEEPMRILEESIGKLGILVPVTVYPKISGTQDTKRGRFVLLDGERRWRCARELRLPSIPAIIVEQPSPEQNILTMFHIHNVREGWQLMPTALKLKALMDALGETNERKLYELTKLSIGQIRRCKILLTFPKRFQDMMLAPPSERMKADFFIELQRIRGPALEQHWPPWLERGDSRSVNILLQKYEKGVIGAVTDFRRLAEIYKAAARIGKINKFYKEFDRLLAKESTGIDDVRIEGASFEPEFKEIRRSAKRLLSQIQDLDPDPLVADEEILETLRRLVKTISQKFSDALVVDERYSEESKFRAFAA
jgi:ParB family transcriptional regulator, chromosome partitioning protein